jgi:hypothetical protein
MVSDRTEEIRGSFPGVDTETPSGSLRGKKGKEEKKDADK